MVDDPPSKIITYQLEVLTINIFGTSKMKRLNSEIINETPIKNRKFLSKNSLNVRKHFKFLKKSETYANSELFFQ